MSKEKFETGPKTEKPRKSVKEIKIAIVKAVRSAVSQVQEEDMMVLMSTLADSNPVIAFDIALRHIDQEWAEKAFLETAKEHPTEALSLAIQHGDQSLIEKVEALIESED